MLPRKFFENVHALMAILALFEEFSAKICLNVLTLILSASPNMMHFVRTFSIMRAYGVRLIALSKRLEIMEKLHSLHEKHFRKWLVEGYAYPPGFAPGHKLQKLSKESSTFQSLGTINFVIFY